MQEPAQEAIILPAGRMVRGRSVCDQAVSGMPVERGIALRRIEVGASVGASSVISARHADGDAALAAPAVAVAGGEEDGIDAAIALTAAFGADLSGGSPDSLAIRTGMAVTSTVGGLVLLDLVDGDGDRVAVGVSHALDVDVDELVIGRPNGGDAGEGPATIGWLIGWGSEDIGRALILARCA